MISHLKIDMEGCKLITCPQWPCCHESVPWVVVVVIQSAVQWHLWAGDIYPSAKCTWSCRYPLPLHATWSLHLSSVEALVDILGRSAWWTPAHKETTVSDAMRRVSCGVGHVTVCIGHHFVWGDVCCDLMHPLWGSSSNWSLIFLFPWKASAFTQTRLPVFRSTMPIFQS